MGLNSFFDLRYFLMNYVEVKKGEGFYANQRIKQMLPPQFVNCLSVFGYLRFEFFFINVIFVSLIFITKVYSKVIQVYIKTLKWSNAHLSALIIIKVLPFILIIIQSVIYLIL
jgi:hypothetical protein